MIVDDDLACEMDSDLREPRCRCGQWDDPGCGIGDRSSDTVVERDAPSAGDREKSHALTAFGTDVDAATPGRLYSHRSPRDR